MGAVSELYKESQIFDSLFKSVVVVIETNDYSDTEDDYIKYFVTVESHLDLITEKIKARVTFIEANITDTIFRFFRADIPPQRVTVKQKTHLFTMDARELLFSNDWNTEYPELLFDALEEKLLCIDLEDVNGKKTSYFYKSRDFYLK